MNVFTTDHPLADPARGDKPSPFSWIATLAVVLFPFLLVLFCISNGTENGEEIGEPPDPFWEVAVAAAVDSLVLVSVAVAMGWLCAWIFRQLHGTQQKTTSSAN